MPIGYFTDSTPLTPLQNPFNVLVDGFNNLEGIVDGFTETRAIRTYRWVNAAERNAETGMEAGDRGYQTDIGMEFIYTGSAWQLDTGGLILIRRASLTGLPSVTMDNVFTPAFRSYKIEMSTTGSTSFATTLALRAGGNTSNTGYDLQANGAPGGVPTPNSVNLLNQPSWSISAATTTNQASQITLWGPNEAAPTMGVLNSFSTANPPTAAASTRVDIRGLFHRNAVAYDGFVFSTTVGNFPSGSLAVYGYA